MAGKKVKIQSPVPIRTRKRLVEIAEATNKKATQALIELLTEEHRRVFGNGGEKDGETEKDV